MIPREETIAEIKKIYHEGLETQDDFKTLASARLPERLKFVVKHRWMGMTFKEIGAMMPKLCNGPGDGSKPRPVGQIGISKSRAAQMYQSAIWRLRTRRYLVWSDERAYLR